MNYSFEEYLILVGIRSEIDYNYSQQDLLDNIQYFRNCYNDELSPYKALLFLHDHIMSKLPKRSDVLSMLQIEAAINAYEKHQMHIDNLVSSTQKAYPPTMAEDKSYPMIWKSEHWKWFLNAE